MMPICTQFLRFLRKQIFRYLPKVNIDDFFFQIIKCNLHSQVRIIYFFGKKTARGKTIQKDKNSRICTNRCLKLKSPLGKKSVQTKKKKKESVRYID